nr:uncharacterized mitochondrial protein AtMg00810-like [Tanacetum cinerariifolium]
GNPQQALKDKRVIDSGCSRHMTGNMSYLSKFKELNGGYVAFGGNPKGGKITGKGKIKTGFQEKFDAEKAGEEVDQTYMLFPVWSAGSTNPQNNDEDAAFDGKEHDFDAKKPESEVILSPSSSAQSKEQDDKTKKKAKRKSLVESVTGYRDLNVEFKDCSHNTSNEVNVAAQQSSFIDASQLLDDPDVPELEDITYSDDEDVIGAVSDFNNLESSILSAFLYGTIEEEVYVCQPPGFEDPKNPDKVYKVVKALYGLHQAPRGWYETLATDLLENGFQKDTIDQTLFIKKQKGDILLVQIYVDDIIFGATNKDLCKSFENLMKDKFQMSSMGELTFFLGLQDSPFDLVAYSDNDYAGASLDIKSTTGGCQFIGCRLISWQCKKQTAVATSSIEAEYVAAASCCAQVLWIQNQLLDYGYIKYALTINLNIYVSCIKQFWNTVIVKQTDDVTRLQALVDRKKVVITEAAIRDVLRLDDAEGVDCLPNEEIFAELARMGYEKPSTKLTFYKAFFLSQWKFLIHTILQSMSAKCTSWNEFSSAMASAVICLSTGADTTVQGDDAQEPSIPSPTLPPQKSQDLPSTSQEALDACVTLARRVEHLEYDKVAQALEITKLKRRVKKQEKGNMVKVLKLRRLKKEDEPAEVQEVVDVVTTAKLITEVVTAASEIVTATSTTISAAEPQVPAAATTTVAPVRVTAASTRRRKRVVIRDPEKESTTIIPTDTKSKDKGKGIMVEEPKPLKKKQQVEMDEEYARKLHKELNKDIDWDVAIEHVKQKAKEDPVVQRYQVMKKRPQIEAQARKNMIMYLKNVVGFRLDYFKGMSYDDIRPIFEAKFNLNITFLLKTKEQLEEEENRAIQSINETPAQKAAKRRKLNEEVEDIKRHLEIMPDEDDDPNNFSDDFLLTTLGAMFERPDGQAQVWKNQRTVHGQAKVKSWKLLESCGVHIITFTTTQLILLVERRYPLSRFTLDQMLNAVRLRVEEQSEMSLELLRFIRQQHQKGQLE